MFHTRCNFSAGGGYVDSDFNYTDNPPYNQEYLDSNEFWCGYGGVDRGETLGPSVSGDGETSNQWSPNGGPPPNNPAFTGSYLQAFAGRGISDVAPQGGWQPMYPSVSTLPVSGTAHEGWGGANSLLNGNIEQPFWDVNNYFLGIDAFDILAQPESFLANSFLGELDDEDNFKFKFAVPINQWGGYTSGLPESQRSPIVSVEEDDFNSVPGNAINTFNGTLTQAAEVLPGGSIYFVFNCNVPGIADAIFKSMVYITPPAGSVQADNRYSVLLTGNSAAATVNSPPPPTDSSERGYSEVEGGNESQTGDVVPERVIQNKPIKVSPFSSPKALKRANIKLEDRDGIRY